MLYKVNKEQNSLEIGLFLQKPSLDGFFYILPYGVIREKWYNNSINVIARRHDEAIP